MSVVIGPVRLSHPSLGAMLCPGWTYGVLSRFEKDRLGELDANACFRRFLLAFARRVEDDVDPTPDSRRAGQPLSRDEVEGLSPGDLDDLALQYLSSPACSLDHDDDASVGGERPAERFLRLARASLDEFRVAMSRTAEKFGSVVMSDNLRNLVNQTSAISKRLEDLVRVPKEVTEAFERLKVPSGLKAMAEAARSAGEGIPALSIRDLGIPIADTEAQKERLFRLSDIRNPVFDTNKLLEGMAANSEQMVEVARLQADLIQSLADTATQALAEAASSSEKASQSAKLAEDSTRLAKVGVWVAVIALLVSVGVSLYAISDAREIAEGDDRQMRELIEAVKEVAKAGAESGAETAARIGDFAEAQRNSAGAVAAALDRLRKDGSGGSETVK